MDDPGAALERWTVRRARAAAAAGTALPAMQRKESRTAPRRRAAAAASDAAPLGPSDAKRNFASAVSGAVARYGRGGARWRAAG